MSNLFRAATGDLFSAVKIKRDVNTASLHHHVVGADVVARPRIISDNGPQFIAKDFKEFIRISGMTILNPTRKSVRQRPRPAVHDTHRVEMRADSMRRTNGRSKTLGSGRVNIEPQNWRRSRRIAESDQPRSQHGHGVPVLTYFHPMP